MSNFIARKPISTKEIDLKIYKKTVVPSEGIEPSTTRFLYAWYAVIRSAIVSQQLQPEALPGWASLGQKNEVF